MTLGEEPITSYFPRLSDKSKQRVDSAKRKLRKVSEPSTDNQPPNPGPSRKRLRKTTSSLSSVSSVTPPPVWDLFGKPRNSKKICRDQVVNKTSTVISLNDDSDCDSTTKSIATSKQGNSIRRIQTKNGATDGERWHRINPPLDDRRNNSIIDISDSPRRLKGRRRSVSSTFSSAGIHSETMCGHDSDTEILSSQASERPDELLDCPSKDPQKSSKGDTRHSEIQSSPQSSHSTFLPIPLADSSENYIESSQTQNILLNYVSPRRSRIPRDFLVPRNEENTDYIVQTSQTQCEIDMWARPDNKLRGLVSRPPVRTPSDVLFAVPRREADMDDIAPQQEHLKILDENEAVQEESVTESDSDGEGLGFSINKSLPQGPLDASGSQCYADQTQTCSSGVSDTIDDGAESLPSVVKEFHDMFSSEGSYPDPFPTFSR